MGRMPSEIIPHRAVILLVVLLTGANARPHCLRSAEPPDFRELLAPVAPLEPAEALKAFEIEPCFRIELIAAEPLVVDPIAAAFDESGQLFVAEDIDYPDRAKPIDKALGRVRLLYDRDEAGRFRRSAIFADKLHWPSGIACWQGGVFVSAPPQIVYLKDTDGDRRADVRTVVFDGFGTAASEDIMNNLKLGIDNWIYGASSYNGGDVHRGSDVPSEIVSMRGRDFRFHPTALQLVSLAGTGDFGNTFDDWGNRFVANAGALVSQPVLRGEYLRNPYLPPKNNMHKASAEKRTVASISPPEAWRVVRKKFWNRFVDSTADMRAARFNDVELAERGFVTGAAGLEIYRGSLFPPEYRGHSFSAEPACNVVVRLALEQEGLLFHARPTSQEREFLASRDNWFRPVNVLNGPEGALYVLDMYREIIEDPSAIPDDILRHIDVTRGRDRGRIYRIVPHDYVEAVVPILGEMSSAELVKELQHADAWRRETAQRLLVERSDKAIAPALAELVRAARSPQARLHALWTLHGLNKLADDVLLAALSDEHASLRENAIRASEGRLNNTLILRYAVLALASDDDLRVRTQCALALGECSSAHEATATLAQILARDLDNSWLTTAVLSSVRFSPLALLEAVVKHDKFVQHPSASALFEQLAAMIAQRGKSQEIGKLLVSLTRQPLADASFSDDMLQSVAAALAERDMRLDTLLAEGPSDLGPARELLASRTADAIHQVERETSSTATRRRAAAWLQHAPYATAAPALASLLTAAQPVEVQLAAIQSLAAQRDKAVGPLLLEHWRSVSPQAHSEMLEALFRDEERLLSLIAALDAHVLTPAQLPPDRRALLEQHPIAAIRTAAARLFSDLPQASRKEIVERYRAALSTTGDAARGSDLFTKHCAACHRLAEHGTAVGPDLAASRTAPDGLLLAILDPSRDVPSNYVSYTVETVEGSVLSGLIAAESETAIVLRRAAGAEDTIARERIEQLQATGQSLMPEGFEQQLNVQQMTDLLAFLTSIRQGAAP